MGHNIRLAGLEYHGVAGATADCVKAVMRLIQYGETIKRARIVSSDSDHCLLLWTDIGDCIAIKSGFASGYGGEGPRGFSCVLQLLSSHGVEIDECEVHEVVLGRIDDSALTTADLKKIESAKPVRPSRWHDYILEEDDDRARQGLLWGEFRPVIPYAILDHRIVDLALSFWDNPDGALLRGYRRLEDAVRKRTGLEEHGGKLFAKAFGGEKPCLCWSDVDDGQRAGRVNLFAGAYLAHRNPRAHQELDSDIHVQLTEFLLLNHLYKLESESFGIPSPS
jgi:hypothetical protein